MAARDEALAHSRHRGHRTTCRLRTGSPYRLEHGAPARNRTLGADDPQTNTSPENSERERDKRKEELKERKKEREEHKEEREKSAKNPKNTTKNARKKTTNAENNRN
jgi:hypothetical protein